MSAGLAVGIMYEFIHATGSIKKKIIRMNDFGFWFGVKV